jgi:hypothetical protein
MALSLMKAHMLNKLQSYSKQNPEEFVTRLYFKFNGKEEYVEDFSTVLNKMSDGLKESLTKGQTLAGDLEVEFEDFVNEKIYDEESGEITSYLQKKLANLFYTVQKLDIDYKERKSKLQENDVWVDGGKALVYKEVEPNKYRWETVTTNFPKEKEDINYTININIQKDDKMDANELIKQIVNGVNKMGIKL